MLGSLPGLLVLGLSVAIVTVDAATSPREIDYVIQNLKVDVYLQTNHEIGHTYNITFRIANTGRTRILTNDDWRIEFCLKGKDLLSEQDFKENGLHVQPGQGCTYYIRPIPGSTINGLNGGESTSITINALGLSIFKHDIFPGFYFQAGSFDPVVINSTATENLDSFVHLAPANSSESDFSRMSPMRRLVTSPSTYDLNRVPQSIVIPSSKSIEVSGANRFIDLSQAQKWYVYADTAVDSHFNATFIEKLTALPGVTRSMLEFVDTLPPTSYDRIFMQISAAFNRSKDDYQMGVRPSATRGTGHRIQMSASTSTGLQNALETMLGVTGLFTVLPEMTIQDDARFGVRSVLLDVTKNFVPKATVKKLIALMKKYKLNNLVMKLGDNYGWRVEMPASWNFLELVNFGSRRCSNESECLPNEFGANSQSGYYTLADFTEIIQYGERRVVHVTPMFNVLGGIRSAKKASHLRYLRMLARDAAEADRLHLNSTNPTIPNAKALTDTLYTDGLLDPCHQSTYEFIKDLLIYLNKIYQGRLREFHAGGDELTKFQGEFQNCKNQQISASDATRKMLKEIQSAANLFGTKVRVNQDVIIDQDTKRCLTPNNQFTHENISIDFWDISPGNQNEWGLSAEELKFINDPVPRVVEGVKEDPLRSFLDKQNSSFNKAAWSKKGLAPWARAYDCANSGYKVILGPEAFFSLDSAYELDFDERGNRKKDRFHIINLHRMMMFEPLNLHTNMDTGYDGYRYLPYRLCYIYDCAALTKPENILGLQATIDTENIRTEAALWDSILPELLLYAEKAWREAPFENILKAEVPQTLTAGTNIGRRTYHLNAEITNFTNTWGYKESGILDYNGYTYRVPRPGAHVDFSLERGGLPPYGVLVTSDMPGADIEFRELHRSNSQWRLMFVRNETTNMLVGGYNMSFPVSNQAIELRTRSTDGQRRSMPIVVRGGKKDIWPKNIPAIFRRGTCMPIFRASIDDVDNMTVPQWQRIEANVPVVMDWQDSMRYSRESNISAVFRQAARNFNYLSIADLYSALDNVLANITTLPTTDPRRQLYEVDLLFSRMRENQLNALEQEYQQCQGSGAGQGRGQGQGQGQSNGRGTGGSTSSRGQQGSQGRGNSQGQGQFNRNAQGRRGASSRGQGR